MKAPDAIACLMGAALLALGVSDAIKTSQHRGGGWVTYAATRTHPANDPGERDEYVDHAEYKRHHYTGCALVGSLGAVILWCALRRPSDARSGCGLPTN